jgi:hypothetical protein
VGVSVRSSGSFAAGRPGYSVNNQTYGGYTWRSLMTYRGASFATGTYTYFKMQVPVPPTYIHIRVSDIRGDGINTEHQRVRGFLNGVAVGVTFEDPVNGAFITGGNIINGAATTTSTVQSAMRAFFTGAVDSIVVSATGFSDYVIVDLFARCDILLPYQLLSFSGQAVPEGIALAWKIGLETQTLGYRLERSTDGILWEEIATLRKSEETTPEKTYRFTDLSPIPGKNLYRLQSIETNGPGQFSRVITVISDPRGWSSGLLIYPNPASDKFVIRLDGAAGSRPMAEILTMDGKVWKRIAITADRTNIDCAGWSRGLYMVRIKGPDGLLLTEKIVLH